MARPHYIRALSRRVNKAKKVTKARAKRSPKKKHYVVVGVKFDEPCSKTEAVRHILITLQDACNDGVTKYSAKAAQEKTHA